MIDEEETPQNVTENVDVKIPDEEPEELNDPELGMVDGIGTAFAEGAINGTLVNTLIEEEVAEGWTTRIVNIKSKITDRNWMGTFRPISEFCAPSKFQKPETKGTVITRLHTNLGYFFTNYVVLFFILMGFTIITSPLLFFSSLAIGYGWYWANSQEQLKLGPVTLEGNTKFVSLSLLTFCITVLIAGSSIIWVLALTAGGSACHAVCHKGPAAIANVEETLELEGLV